MPFLRRASLAVVIVVVLAACDTGSTATTTDGVGTTTTTTIVVGETTTTQPSQPITELPGTEDLPQDVREELLVLVNLTQDLRELGFTEPPLISVVSDAELEARVRAQIEEEAEDFPVDEALYKLLGLLSPTADLTTLLTDLYG
ncbi:MAG: hypothetical protein OEM39_08125, partial [Acidimicrobiia bacterium]|nr:hypothetical protein [Acidimicrobiia bacterium]